MRTTLYPKTRAIASHEYERRWGTSKVVVWKRWAVYLWSFVRNLI